MLTFLININKQYWRALTLLVLALITLGSLFPVEHLPTAPGSDKTHHLIGYCALMLPVAIRRPKYWLAFALFFIAWSGLIEIIQPYVNRYGEWLDMLANACGVVIAIFISQILRYLAVRYNTN
jgi:VanZ family protein